MNKAIELIKKYIITVLIISITAGCSISNQTYTMKISSEKLQKNMQTRFPIQKDVMFGKIELVNPIIKLKNNSDSLITGLTFAYKPPFFKKQQGTLYISGKINYDKNKKAFYLKNPKINEMKFNNNSLTTMVPDTLKNVMAEFISELFLQYPIYKIKTDSLKGKIFQKTLKSTTIKDGELQLTFGL